MKWADREIIGLLQNIRDAGGGGAGGGAGTNGAITGGSLTVNTSGISINLPAYLTTAALSQNTSNYAGINGAITGGSITVNTSGVSVNLPAYLTTARGSTDAVGLNTAQTNVTWTVNSSGISLNAGNYAGTVTGATGASITANTAGISINLPAYLTTADLSQNSSKYAGINGAITGGSITVNTSGVSVNLPAYLTTARASTDAVGLNTAQTNVTWTVNSSGISLNAGAYAGTVTGATNCSVTANTSGISVNAAAPAPATLSYYENMPAFLAYQSSTVGGSSNRIFPFSLPNYISASYIRFLATSNFVSTSLGTSAIPTSTTFSAAHTLFVNIYSQGVGASSRSLQHVTSASAGWTWQLSITEANATNNYTVSANLTWPSEGLNTNAVAWNSAVTLSTINISTTDATYASFTGNRFVDVPFAASMSPGNYWMALMSSSTTAGGQNIDMNMAIVGNSLTNSQFAKPGAAANSSNQAVLGLGSWSTNTVGTTTSSIGLANVSSAAGHWRPYFQIIRQN